MTVTTPVDDTLNAFLSSAGWAGADIRPLAGDASTRSYKRLEKAGARAVLMLAPPGAESAACPPDAGEAERRALGYNAMARLAGPNLNAFIAVSNALRSSGLTAPEVYAADPASGFAVIEDLGDDLYARTIGAHDERELYMNAVDVLLKLRASPPPRPSGAAYSMLDYDRTALEAEAALLTEWYWPHRKGAPAPDDLQAEYAELFAKAIGGLAPAHSLVLRDYHAENLLWLPDRTGVSRVGLIDFQDGLYGSAAYDLVSLLEDARRDVAQDLAEAMIGHYCEHAAGDFDKAAFMNDYAILAAQRNAKILGVFARLYLRDKKPRYLDFMPRVEAHFRRDLARPGLEPLRGFIAKHFPDLAP